MLAFIKGIVASIGDSCMVLECNNIGYELTVSSRCLSNLTVGQDAKIYTYMAVREDGISLYGFGDLSEKEMFLNLITVSGVGPKLAISILGGISSSALIGCIASGDVASLNSIKGIGKKTAERILLELKGKIKADASVMSTDGAGAITAPALDDATLALMSLGYSGAEAFTALSHVQGKENMTTEEIIMAALRG